MVPFLNYIVLLPPLATAGRRPRLHGGQLQRFSAPQGRTPGQVKGVSGRAKALPQRMPVSAAAQRIQNSSGSRLFLGTLQNKDMNNEKRPGCGGFPQLRRFSSLLFFVASMQ